MVELSSIFTAVLLLPACKCAALNIWLQQPRALYNQSHYATANPEAKMPILRWSYYTYVVVDSFDLGMTALSLASTVNDQDKFPQLDPRLAYYHTNAWRWILRQLSLYPDIFYKKFCQLHKVWRRRFYFEDVFVPQWLKTILVWVNDTTWDKEENMTQRYNTYSKRHFDKYDKYPPTKFVSRESFSKSVSDFYPGKFGDTLYDEKLPIGFPDKRPKNKRTYDFWDKKS